MSDERNKSELKFLKVFLIILVVIIIGLIGAIVGVWNNTRENEATGDVVEEKIYYTDDSEREIYGLYVERGETAVVEYYQRLIDGAEEDEARMEYILDRIVVLKRFCEEECSEQILRDMRLLLDIGVSIENYPMLCNYAVFYDDDDLSSIYCDWMNMIPELQHKDGEPLNVE